MANVNLAVVPGQVKQFLDTTGGGQEQTIL
ncbi:hypothetical protein J2X83_005563 [Brevibacillus nitrificans]|nr:hypothetical protein [Brevibacillus nitrificans]